MEKLNDWYQNQKEVNINTLAEYHWRFESIHPFQDGNGRVGRLILFRECLRNDVMPFVIDNEHKLFYYRGLSEFKQTPGFLVGTMQSAQVCMKHGSSTSMRICLKGSQYSESNSHFYANRARKPTTCVLILACCWLVTISIC